MIAPKVNANFCSPKQIARLGKAVGADPWHQARRSILTTYPAGLRLACAAAPGLHQSIGAPRSFSTTSAARLRDFFPEKETANIRQTPAAWPHHGYTEEQMLAVEVGHREPRNLSDRIAWNLVMTAKWCMDKATGLKKEQKDHHGSVAKPLTEAQWLVRFIFLESIAACPGMVAGMVRHLHSIRRLKRDNGWIETMLEEAYNERMHLLTFMKMCEPGWFMKFILLGAQGVYFNALFLAYLLSPKTCHRFTGYLEEQATETYTRCIREIEMGVLPKWSDPSFNIPDIAVNYWKIPEGQRTMKNLIMYIRADEANHRGVHHTLASLEGTDPNPFTSIYKDPKKAPVALTRITGYEREEVI